MSPPPAIASLKDNDEHSSSRSGSWNGRPALTDADVEGEVDADAEGDEDNEEYDDITMGTIETN